MACERKSVRYGYSEGHTEVHFDDTGKKKHDYTMYGLAWPPSGSQIGYTDTEACLGMLEGFSSAAANSIPKTTTMSQPTVSPVRPKHGGTDKARSCSQQQCDTEACLGMLEGLSTTAANSSPKTTMTQPTTSNVRPKHGGTDKARSFNQQQCDTEACLGILEGLASTAANSSPKTTMTRPTTTSPVRAKHGDKARSCSQQQQQQQCDKSFRDLCNLKTELGIHTGQKHFYCKQCGKTFSRLDNVKRHERIHSGEKPFHCKQCDKSFSQLDHLNRHQHIHTGEKPFHCKHCKKSFNQSHHLKKHARLHIKVDPLHCKLCDKHFSKLDNMKRHQRIHTGERPFHCKQCTRSFNQSSHLRKHERIHTGERPFHCKQCDKSFSQSSHLKKHTRIHIVEKPA